MPPKQVNYIFGAKVQKRWPTHVKIYTDGSKIADMDNLGAAVLVPEHNISSKIKLPKECSIFTAECAALKEALILSNIHNFNKIVIFSDSLSLVQLLSSPLSAFHSNALVLEVKHLLYSRGRAGGEADIVWIPSHSGIQGNEEVDELARSAITTGETPEDFTVPASDFKIQLALESRNKWKQWWDRESCVRGSAYRGVQSEIPSRPWFHGTGLSRSDISHLCRMRFNHHRLNSHLFRINVVDTPYCECGLDLETLDHVFLGCPLRDAYDLCSALPSLPFPTSIAHLLSLNDVRVRTAILKFINKNLVVL
jgi:ribonuclease HI